MPTFFKGRKKTLDEGDLYKALKEHKSGKCMNHLFNLNCIFQKL